MKAWIGEGAGRSAVFREATLPTPAPGPGEVLLRVRAVGLNLGPIHQDDVRTLGVDQVEERVGRGGRRADKPLVDKGGRDPVDLRLLAVQEIDHSSTI